MDKETMLELIVENSENITYLCDLQTHDILYMNKAAKQAFHIHQDTNEQNLKCYEMFQQKTHPCTNCTNPQCSPCHPPNSSYFSSLSNQYYRVDEQIISLDQGKQVRLVIAVDITKNEQEKQKLDQQVHVDETLLSCIRTLSDADDQERAIHELLRTIGEYYDANRSYIFELDRTKAIAVNTYEWCKAGITSEKAQSQHIPLSMIEHWIHKLQEDGIFYITSIHQELDETSGAYHILERQNIQGLILAPLIEHGMITGLIGVDDPNRYTTDFRLLSSIAYFVLNDIQKRKLIKELERLSYQDILTGIFNRNRYQIDLQYFMQFQDTSMGIAYLDINNLKYINDHFGHEEGDRKIKLLASLLMEEFPNQAYRIGGDEFIILCPDITKEKFHEKLTTLNHRLLHHGEALASLGVLWVPNYENLPALVAQADQKMYRMKNEKEEVNKESHQTVA